MEIKHIRVDDLPMCQPYMTGARFIHPKDKTTIIEKGDLIQIFAPRCYFHKWVGIVDSVYTNYFCIVYRDHNNTIQTSMIDPLSEGFYWDEVQIKKLNSVDEAE